MLLGWIDPLAFGLVLGGSAAVAMMRASRAEIGGAFAVLLPLVRANPAADAVAALRTACRVERITEARNIVCVDRVATAGRFFSEAIVRLSDAAGSADYARWADETLEARRLRHEGIAGFWRAIADTAPAMGMIATVLGLIRMFSQLDDPSRIGAPMATALIATLLGLVVANLFAGPIADRLERLSQAELRWQRQMLDRFIALAHAELDRPAGLQQTLRKSFSA